jgi:hypothetical protein
LTPWYSDPAARRFIALRYLPWLAALNFAWEWAHVRFYTIWTQADLAYITFSVAHCTLGDLLIGSASLVLALMLGREGPLSAWHNVRIAALSTLIGTIYTVFSEWMNVTLLRSWAYADAMPRLSFGAVEIGVTPVLQWMVIPAAALYLARGTSRVMDSDLKCLLLAPALLWIGGVSALLADKAIYRGS